MKTKLVYHLKQQRQHLPLSFFLPSYHDDSRDNDENTPLDVDVAVAVADDVVVCLLFLLKLATKGYLLAS